MKPNDKAYREFMRVYNKTHVSLEAQIMASLTAAYAAQFKSVQYAELVKELREDLLQFNLKDTVYENVAKNSADAIEAVLAKLNDKPKPSQEYAGLIERLRKNSVWGEVIQELAMVRAERDALKAERDEWRRQAEICRDKLQETEIALGKCAQERGTLAARLAPVEDKELTEMVARAICLNRAGDACNCKENGVCKAPLENLREYNEVWPQACASIAAIRPHIEAAERERASKDYESLVQERANQAARAFAAAIRRGE